MKRPEPSSDLSFTGEPISAEEATEKWPLRYRSSKARVSVTLGTPKDGDIEENLEQAKRHYSQALVDGTLFSLGDDVYVKAEEGNPNYIAKIVEFFEAVDGEPYFRARWFYRPEDTVIKTLANEVQEKRVFLSNVEDDNPLNCIVSRVNIVKVPAKIVTGAEERVIPPCDFYYDMKYELAHLTFSTAADEGDASSTISSESDSNCIQIPQKKEKFLLDLYSGCGAMSTGLCMGASLSGIKLTKKWAVDINSFACDSLRLNHPETEVRNEAAEDFLKLLIEWRKLCQKFALISSTEVIESDGDSEDEEEDGDVNDDADGDSSGSEIPPEEFEVDKFLDICFGNPKGLKEASALHLKVRWKGYGPDEDTWEPYDGLRKCKEKLKEFVTTGFNTNRFPLPGDVHFVCGGPPCQGISGFNRFRNNKAPLEDEKNQQLLVYMNIIDYLKPNYVLMENVVDLLKFSKGFCARYAVARLVAMNYQTRLGMMSAGSYGVPQVRNRVFLWGAQPTEKLPPYPLPTHETLAKSLTPTEFEEIQVGYSRRNLLQLEKALTLADAISDLPPATNYEKSDERKYETKPQTNFQKYIRLSRAESIIPLDGRDASKSRILYDHQPLELNDDDLERVCHIVKKKGANFRDLPGVIVEDNKVKFDPSVERPKLKSGKFLVPDYAVSFVNGKSKKPFGRLWWDEIVHTVVTRAEPHNQIVIHPLQDRVLTVRENARIQGFPDFYKLCGPIKEKYIQVGNAVAVPVGVALGYAFGLASQGLSDNQPVIKLPFMYPQCMQGKTEEHSA
ncbi:putative DNA (cytosine-5)-methyltransferase CMT1 [Raphanus sativus]|uniref:DNA (cytosine-5-)-methyltransferase n=1 Tax=Raphanus sativus TaxID=3726 RepID=A0A9W3DFC9_RAPSA|nr:putative DNA (cytosine-5)-methyltransferase CMT1 [Raphanus sativus]KAJ4915432.1 putative DNA (cytosine-5)-methyltransferase CMT1 [Raphanus sativus]